MGSLDQWSPWILKLCLVGTSVSLVALGASLVPWIFWPLPVVTLYAFALLLQNPKPYHLPGVLLGLGIPLPL